MRDQSETNELKQNTTYGEAVVQEEEMNFNLRFLLFLFLRYKYWILISIVACMAVVWVYLRYQSPVYGITAKILIKDQDAQRNRISSINNTLMEMGLRNSSEGFDNEVEVLSTRTLNKRVVRDMKLYVSYHKEGRVKDAEVYGKYSPYLVDYDNDQIDTLANTIEVEMAQSDKFIKATIRYKDAELTKTITSFPSIVRTSFGNVTIAKNPQLEQQGDNAYILDRTLFARIKPINTAAAVFTSRLSVEETSKLTTIASITFTDNIPERGVDYVNELAKAYNEDANDYNMEEARRTADFIDERLGIISRELSTTEAELEQYKISTRTVEYEQDAATNMSQNIRYENQIVDVSTQIQLVDYLSSYVNDHRNNYQVIPSNVGLTDASLTATIAKYNEAVMERNRLLRTVAENNPSVSTLTEQLDGYMVGIRSSLASRRRQLALQRRELESQQAKYNTRISAAPTKERALKDINRQQEVKSGLYLMLLQKREENAIRLASAAYKGKVIEEPIAYGPIAPKKKIFYLVAFVVGLLIPFVVYYVRQFFRYRIEGKDDLARLTSVPLLGAIPLVKALAKGNRTIVVQENHNSLMVEVYRTLRSNLPFVLKGDQNVILFTSSVSGEGKTTIASNLAASIAFMGKRVIIVGLDIRKPRLASLFNLPDTEKGITTYLSHDPDDFALLDSLVQNTDVSPNLDILAAGPIPPNPAELLERENLAKAIDHLRKKYDYVLLDTAPVGMVADTVTIAQHADATLFIVRANYTLKSDIELINELADDKRLHNVNLVLNAVKEERTSNYGYGRYGYGYGRYGYGYGYGQKDGQKLEEV